MSVYVQFAPYRLAQRTDWTDARSAARRPCCETLERYAPGIGRLIEHQQVLTPVDLEGTLRPDRRPHPSRRAVARPAVHDAAGAGLGAVPDADRRTVPVRRRHASGRRPDRARPGRTPRAKSSERSSRCESAARLSGRSRCAPSSRSSRSASLDGRGVAAAPRRPFGFTPSGATAHADLETPLPGAAVADTRSATLTASSPTSRTSPDRRAIASSPNGRAISSPSTASRTSRSRRTRCCCPGPKRPASRWSRRGRGAPRCARSRSTAIPTRRFRRSRRACRTTRTRRPARSPRRVVYAGSGNPADYDCLRVAGHRRPGQDRPRPLSVPYSYRGFKALTAQQRGAAGILIYSDPADDGCGKGAVYPDGPWGPASHIQRGGIVYDFMVPGDPLTPGWASVPGARRIDRRERGVAPDDHQRAALVHATRASHARGARRAAMPGRGAAACPSPTASAARTATVQLRVASTTRSGRSGR